MGKGFWWFVFVCITGFTAWGGTKIFKIDNTEARVTVLEASDLRKTKEISDFKTEISGQYGELKGQNQIIIQLLKELKNERRN